MSDVMGLKFHRFICFSSNGRASLTLRGPDSDLVAVKAFRAYMDEREELKMVSQKSTCEVRSRTGLSAVFQTGTSVGETVP